MKSCTSFVYNESKCVCKSKKYFNKINKNKNKEKNSNKIKQTTNKDIFKLQNPRQEENLERHHKKNYLTYRGTA